MRRYSRLFPRAQALRLCENQQTPDVAAFFAATPGVS